MSIAERCFEEFLNADGTANNAFEGSDSDPVIPCPDCIPAQPGDSQGGTVVR